MSLGLGRLLAAVFDLLVVAPTRIVYRRIRDFRRSPPAQLQETFAGDLRAAGLLSSPKDANSYERVAAIVIRNCRMRMSLGEEDARRLIEDAVVSAGELLVSGAGLRIAAEVLAWRLHTRRLA